MSKKSASHVTRSYASIGSGMSNGSAAAKARAKAEGAKARLAYAEKEMDLMLEKVKLKTSMEVEEAKIEATMEMLRCQKETAAAIAEAQVFEAACALESEKQSCSLKLDTIPSLEPAERTKQYVSDQATIMNPEEQYGGEAPKIAEPAFIDNIANTALKPDATPFNPHLTKVDVPTCHFSSQQTRRYIDEYLDRPNEVSFDDGKRAATHPSSQYAKPVERNDDNQNVKDFVRYLARREIVATGLLQFNDRPENYRAWKRSFLTATDGLSLTPSEEMDLLLK